MASLYYLLFSILLKTKRITLLEASGLLLYSVYESKIHYIKTTMYRVQLFTDYGYIPIR